MSGIVVAGTHSGCGKTTMSLGLISAFKKRGFSVQPFKAGPDFIDAGLHRMITGRASRNLDLWMCGEDYVKTCFYKHSRDADISIVEGVMGLYDGEFSTATLANILNLPVILVIDAYAMAESVGAIVKGFVEYNSNFRGSKAIAGVILNRVASERHFKRLKDSISDADILGYLPRSLNFIIPHRHLGLTVAEEEPISKENIERLTDAVIEHVDVEKILTLTKKQRIIIKGREEHKRQQANVKVAIAYDKAFSFYYEDNLDLLRDAGAEIIRFSPLYDKTIPEVDAIYIGGGYPELYAKELADNTSMLSSIKEWANAGRPMYAECGGLMYLCDGIYDLNGNFFKMVGVFDFKTQMRRDSPHLGYRKLKLTDDCILGNRGDILRGHEFHYSEIIRQQTDKVAGHQADKNCFVRDNRNEPTDTQCYRFKNTFASYIHIHFGSNPAVVKSFINSIKSVTNR